MNHRTLFFILLFFIIQPISVIGQSLERQPEYQPSSDCITIDGRTYKICADPEIRRICMRPTAADRHRLYCLSN